MCLGSYAFIHSHTLVWEYSTTTHTCADTCVFVLQFVLCVCMGSQTNREEILLDICNHLGTLSLLGCLTYALIYEFSASHFRGYCLPPQQRCAPFHLMRSVTCSFHKSRRNCFARMLQLVVRIDRVRPKRDQAVASAVWLWLWHCGHKGMAVVVETAWGEGRARTDDTSEPASANLSVTYKKVSPCQVAPVEHLTANLGTQKIFFARLIQVLQGTIRINCLINYPKNFLRTQPPTHLPTPP